MFKKKTVFVIGAGASTDYKIPIGSHLTEIIHQKCDIKFKAYNQTGSGDYELYDRLKGAGNPGEVQKACWRIRDGILQSNSIDDFLNLHQDDELMRVVGKSAIVRTILEGERDSLLMPQEAHMNFDPMPVRNSWAWKLLRMIGSSADKANLFQNVTFVSFNYDRCLERVLWQGVRDLYALPQDRMIEVMAPLKIYYPYGKIGPLPVSGLPDAVPFGGHGYDDYRALSKNIITYTEQVRDKKDMASVESALNDADQIVFLGFGFHSQNMQLLTVKGLMKYKRAYATVFNVPPPNVQVMGDRIGELFLGNDRVRARGDFKLVGQTAADLLDSYSMELTA